MTFKDNVERELIKMILRGHELADNSKLDDADEINVFTALSAITKLVEGLKNGAYKSGYHDALNNRPFKIRERLR